MKLLALAFVAVAAATNLGASCQGEEPPAAVAELHPEVLSEHPHDPAAYTQGLEVRDGHLYESTGLRGRSSLREVDLATGRVIRQVDLPSPMFGEGIALVGDRLIQLTWQERTALVYDVATFEQVGSFTYDTEGWGLCFDGTDLVMSDGTDRLFRRDPDTFEVRSVVHVTRGGEPQGMLNELECVDGQVWANVYQTDEIVEIDPGGAVVAVVDASSLVPRVGGSSPGVLNGIAHDESDGTFLLTGKNWPSLFVVTFGPDPERPAS